MLSCFNSDTCNTMKGQHNGVAHHLKDKQPKLINLGCICHLENLHVALKAVMKCLPVNARLIPSWLTLTLSFPVVLLNSPNLSPYFSLNKFERILRLIFSGLLCLINSHFLITKSLILSVLCEEKVGVDK